MTSAPRSRHTLSNHITISRQTARGPADLRKSIKHWGKSCWNLREALGSKAFCHQICKILVEFEHTSRAPESFPAKSKTAAFFKSP